PVAAELISTCSCRSAIQTWLHISKQLAKSLRKTNKSSNKRLRLPVLTRTPGVSRGNSQTGSTPTSSGNTSQWVMPPPRWPPAKQTVPSSASSSLRWLVRSACPHASCQVWHTVVARLAVTPGSKCGSESGSNLIQPGERNLSMLLTFETLPAHCSHQRHST